MPDEGILGLDLHRKLPLLPCRELERVILSVVGFSIGSG